MILIEYKKVLYFVPAHSCLITCIHPQQLTIGVSSYLIWLTTGNVEPQMHFIFSIFWYKWTSVSLVDFYICFNLRPSLIMWLLKRRGKDGIQSKAICSVQNIWGIFLGFLTFILIYHSFGTIGHNQTPFSNQQKQT